MAEDNVQVLRSDIEHMKVDIIEIKANAKEQSIAMLSMRDSHTETKIYIKQIQESQNAMAKKTDDNQALASKQAEAVAQKAETAAQKAEASQIATMKAIQDIKDEPNNNWKKLSTAWKVAIISTVVTLLGSYIGGTIFGILKNMAK